MKTRSVLIIESSPGVGPSLARELRNLHPAWSVATSDAAAGLAVLEAGTVDAVVPIVSTAGGGGSLAEWIQQRHGAIPQVAVRVDGLGHWDDPVALRGAAASIGRALVLSERLHASDLVRFATGLKRVPVISAIYQDLCQALALNLVADGPQDLSGVERLIGEDPGLAVRVLRLANSPRFGLPQPVTGIPEAVAVLGVRRIASLMLGVTSGDQIHTSGSAGRVVEGDWHNAMLVAHLSRKIVQYEGGSPAETEAAYSAGLLHNLGRLLLVGNRPRRFSAIDWPERTTSRLEVERAEFGATHPALAALLLGFWGLDDAVAEAVAFYADPSQAASRGFGPLAAVHAAAVLIGHGRLDWDFEFLREAGLLDRIGEWALLDDVRQAADSAR